MVEIDGELHKFRRKNDNERDQIMNLMGLKIIRIRNEMVIQNPDAAISLIKRIFIK